MTTRISVQSSANERTSAYKTFRFLRHRIIGLL